MYGTIPIAVSLAAPHDAAAIERYTKFFVPNFSKGIKNHTFSCIDKYDFW
jgi:hypothetical protein